MPRKIFLIDGHALVFKMYYAFIRRPMINSKGADMSILYGFTKYILELIEREAPDYLAVAFDPPGGTFRNKMYPEYKANRAETPQLVIDALEPLQELCEGMNIPTLMMPGFEADDVIGSVAKRCAREGLDVYMVTPDKDYGQLVEDHIWQYKPGKSGGDNEVLGVREILGKYGIQSPAQVIDMLTICGDTADNVPGVKGVGEVGAGKLVAKYGSVQGIYDHLDELSPRQKAMFEEARDHIALSHELVTIKTDIDVEVPTESMRVDKAYGPELSDLFEKYEFNSLQRFLGHVASPNKDEKQLEINKVTPSKVISAAKKAGVCSVIVSPRGVTLGTAVLRQAQQPENLFLASEGSVKDFKSLFEDDSVAKCGDDLKRQMNILAASGISLDGPLFDIGLMHYLIDPEKSHKVEVLARSLAGLSIEAKNEDKEVTTGSLFDEIPSDDATADRSREGAILLILKDKLQEELKARGASELYGSMEEPLLRVLSRMERNGVRVDLGSLKDFTSALREEMVQREAKVRELAGEPFLNVSSPKQVGEILFEKLGLSSKPKKNANGTYSTDETTLLDIADKHPIVDEILEFRAVKKLLSTYIEPFPSFIDPSDGKIHTTFNQALTSTGRLSSSNPNLQNIPIRMEQGKLIRKVFYPKEGYTFVDADYSQIDLRVLAHMSGDEMLIDAYRQDKDIHRITASQVFHIPFEEVTSLHRRNAKAVNFGIVYGISSFGLSQDLSISRKEAAEYIEKYFETYPKIKEFLDKLVADAKEKKYAITMYGRRRPVPELSRSNFMQRQFGERIAMNSPIQGTAADIIKIAMIDVYRTLKERGLRSKLILQVHDELLIEAYEDEADAVKEVLAECMMHAADLRVALLVDMHTGADWYEAK